MSNPTDTLELIILIPVYNDWESARLILTQLDDVLTGQPVSASLLFIDDFSSVPAPPDLASKPFTNLRSVEILRLRRNLGHQRAIAVGLSFIHAERKCEAVVIMDCDGEDKPQDVPRLIQHFLQGGRSKVVFARRIRRSENIVFRVGYRLYRLAHRVLTGISVRVGNFSIIPMRYVATLVVVSDTWNHYAASVFKSRIPFEMLSAARGKRLAGESKMDVVALVMHGLSAISVFAETVGVRLTLAIFSGIILLISLLVAVIAIRFGTDLAIPGWATTAGGLLLIIVFQMLSVALGLTLLILSNRNNLSFLPLRDYPFFVAGIQKCYERTL